MIEQVLPNIDEVLNLSAKFDSLAQDIPPGSSETSSWTTEHTVLAEPESEEGMELGLESELPA